MSLSNAYMLFDAITIKSKFENFAFLKPPGSRLQFIAILKNWDKMPS